MHHISIVIIRWSWSPDQGWQRISVTCSSRVWAATSARKNSDGWMTVESVRMDIGLSDGNQAQANQEWNGEYKDNGKLTKLRIVSLLFRRPDSGPTALEGLRYKPARSQRKVHFQPKTILFSFLGNTLAFGCATSGRKAWQNGKNPVLTSEHF